MIVPASVFVEDDGRAEAPGRVDAGPGDGDRGQVHQEHREPDGQRSQYLHTWMPKHNNPNIMFPRLDNTRREYVFAKA